jgi:septum formation inhibitor MinC
MVTVDGMLCGVCCVEKSMEHRPQPVQCSGPALSGMLYGVCCEVGVIGLDAAPAAAVAAGGDVLVCGCVQGAAVGAMPSLQALVRGHSSTCSRSGVVAP